MIKKKITSLYPSDFESAFVWHLTGEILSFEFYPKAIFFERKFGISRSAVVHVQNLPIGLPRVWIEDKRTSKSHLLIIAACKRNLCLVGNVQEKFQNNSFDNFYNRNWLFTCYCCWWRSHKVNSNESSWLSGLSKFVRLDSSLVLGISCLPSLSSRWLN